MDINLLRVIADAMNDATGLSTCGIMHAEHFANVLRSKGAVAPSWPVIQEPSHGNLWEEAEAIAEEFAATARRMATNSDLEDKRNAG